VVSAGSVRPDAGFTGGVICGGSNRRVSETRRGERKANQPGGDDVAKADGVGIGMVEHRSPSEDGGQRVSAHPEQGVEAAIGSAIMIPRNNPTSTAISASDATGM
jgi:hypothetical protein